MMELVRLPKIKVNNILSDVAQFEDLEAAITLHEIKPACNRHTVYKLYVYNADKKGWFITRRYREFHKLRNDLKKCFPAKEFTLPPKRYFGDNFDPRFLNSRRQGLQGFLYMITRQREVLTSPPVAEFLGMNNPPTALEDVEQCKAVIEQLQSELTKLRMHNYEHNTSVTNTNGHIGELQLQKQAVLSALRYERQQNGKKYYPGDDLSLMFEYRALPEVSRIDVSSFLVRKQVGGIQRKPEEKTRKDGVPREEVHVANNKRNRSARSSGEELRAIIAMNRARAHTPPLQDYTKNDPRCKDPTRKWPPYIEIQSPKSKDRYQCSSSDDVASPGKGEFKSFYQFKQRRKSMPGAVELHKMNELLKTPVNHVKLYEPPLRHASLCVPGTDARPRSFSANPAQPEEILESGLKHAALERVRKQASLESPKRKIAWSSLKDLRKLKNKP